MSKSESSKLKKECDELWAKCVKARAGHKSELSGKTEGLHAHHLRGKSNYALRYCLDNGICVTAGEHFYGFHNTARRASREERVKLIRGKDIFEKLELMGKNFKLSKISLIEVKIYLEQELKKYTKD